MWIWKKESLKWVSDLLIKQRNLILNANTVNIIFNPKVFIVMHIAEMIIVPILIRQWTIGTDVRGSNGQPNTWGEKKWIVLVKNAFIAPKGNNTLTQMLLICFIVRECKDQYYNIQAICFILAVNGFFRVGKVNRYLRRENHNLYRKYDEVKKNDNSQTYSMRFLQRACWSK